MNLFVRKRTVNAKTTTSKGKSTTSIKGRTIRKVKWGGGGVGWGKNQKKIHARENAKKKIRAKKKGKKKNSCRRKVQL